MQKPITSRIKRSPLLQTNNIDATGSRVTPGEDKEVKVTETKEKEQVGGFRRACGSTTDGSTKTDPTTGKSYVCSQASEGNEPEETETITTTKIEPGEDTTIDTKLYKKEKQDVKEPWEVRRSNRAAKIQGRAQRRSQNKSDKISRQLAKMDDADKVKGNKKYDKLMAKQTENSQELSNMKQGSYNVAEGRRSGKLAGSRFEREQDAIKSRGDYTDPEQIEQEVNKRKAIAASGMTTSQAAGAVNVSANPFSQSLDSAKAIAEEGLNYKSGGYTPFKMKGKSPAAKTLKGNQSKLPQHLQDSIKAAPSAPAKLGPLAAIAAKAVIGKVAGKLMSPGKMKSSFKMKGYGKK